MKGDRDITLIAVRARGAVRLLLCEADGVRENVADTTSLLRTALDAETSSRPQSIDVAPAIDWLLAEQRTEELRLSHRNGVQAAAAQKLLRAAAALPVNSATARTADRMLRRLSQPLSHEAEVRLLAWVNAAAAVPAETVRTLAAALGPAECDPRQTAVKPSVVAVLAVRKSPPELRLTDPRECR
jgi:hypothetical protein